MVIKKMSEMIDSKPVSRDIGIDAALSNNNGVVPDKENNVEVKYSLFWYVFYINEVCPYNMKNSAMTLEDLDI